MNIQDAVVFITGANRGLGLAFAKSALQAGARKVYAAARDPATVTLPGVVPIRLNVNDLAQVQAAVEACGDVTVLVNNSGIFRPIDVLAPDALAKAQEELDTNFMGLWRMSQAFAPVLGRQEHSAIVNVLSVLSWLAVPGVSAYCASKAAAWSITGSLRQALGPQGTQVMALHVGYMDTDMASTFDGPKADPLAVAEGAFRALGEGATEYVADDFTQEVKQSLAQMPPKHLKAA